MSNRPRWFSRRKKREQEMNDELRFHIERQTAENIAAGLPPEEARRQAVLQLGAVEGVKENCREERSGFWLESCYADVHFGLRMLLKNWRLTSVAVFSLAVAMAVSVAGLSVFNAVMLRPPAATAPDRLVTIYTRSPAGEFENVSYPDYKYYRDNNRVFSGLAAFPNSILKFDMTFGDRDESATISTLSDNYFAVMGIRPALGQMFVPGDDDKKTPGAVLSYSCWKRWGGDLAIIGKTLTLRRHTLTILGVAPQNFPGTVFGFASDVFITLATAADIFQDPGSLTDRTQRGLLLVARLKQNATQQQARTELQTLSGQLASAFPQADEDRVAVFTNISVLPPDSRSTAALISGVLILIVLLVLLIACANVANLLLGLAAGRRQEVLIRVALGATRGRLLRQLLTETAILCAASGIAGFLIAMAPLVKLSDFNATLPVLGAFELAANFRPDGTVLAMTLGLIFIAGLAAGLAPALYSSKPNLAAAMTGEIAVGGTRKGVLRNALVVIQVAVCTLVMVGVGLCLRSLHNLRAVNPGFTARNIAAVMVDMQESGYSEAQGQKFYEDLRREASQLYGVESFCLASSLPLGGNDWSADEVHFTGAAGDDQQHAKIAYNPVDANYFATLGIPLLSGRTFEPSDTDKSPEVVVINHKMAETYWPGADPIGKQVRVGDSSQVMTIIGVVGDGKYSDLDEPTRPYMYYNLIQHYQIGIALIVRTQGNPRQWLAPLVQTVRKLGGKSALPPVTLDEWMRFTLFVPILTLEVVSGLGALALLLAAVGLYGTIFHSVSERKKEIGIRVALGALPSHLLHLFLRQTAIISGLGVLIGLLLGIAATIIFNAQFYGIRPVELQVLIPVALLMVLISMSIAYGAARPWINANPMDAVRHT
jgi:macrolide transport system ATP-binding/permease protein